MSNLQTYIKYYEDNVQLATSFANKGEMGMVRSTMKEVVEGLLDLIWKTEIGGESKKNDFIESVSKSGYSLKFQVDRHLYHTDGTMAKIGECKAYLDRCFMERASSDFGRILNGVQSKPTTFILALENSVSDKAYEYYMDEGNIHKVFYLCDGKRSSTKPIWRNPHYKPINETKLQDFVDFIRNY
jgi:hypothetical protein